MDLVVYMNELSLQSLNIPLSGFLNKLIGILTTHVRFIKNKTIIEVNNVIWKADKAKTSVSFIE